MKTAPLSTESIPQALQFFQCPLCGKHLQSKEQHHQCPRDNRHLSGQVECEICRVYFKPGPNGEGCPGCAEST